MPIFGDELLARLMKIPSRFAPRWVIFLIDVGLVVFGLFAAYMLRFDFRMPANEVGPLIFAFPFFLLIRISSFLVARTYAGVIRYTSSEDALRIISTLVLGSSLFALLNPIKFYLWDHSYFLPFTIIILEFVLSTVFMLAFRLMVKLIYLEVKNPRSAKSDVILYGAGEAGVITKRTLDRDAGTRYRVVAFIDDSRKKAGSRLEGVTVYHTSSLPELLKTHAVEHVIICIQKPRKMLRDRVIESSINAGVKVLTVPPVHQWINGELSFRQIKEVKIDDLLGREEIVLDEASISNDLRSRIVLVTGAAGSIGSGLVRQILQFKPTLLVLLDQAESALYDLEQDLRRAGTKGNWEVVIGDISNSDRMRNVFKTFKPEIVFHAAAYKHVPLMELNPSEAILTNVLGTRILVDLAIEYEVDKFVMISTDKAVNPTSVMGASKRMAEIYAQSSNSRSNTRFITTRFGNVLGSNGSVIPLFHKQIENGGPVTVTHPEVTRFFMTIPEACRLVLEAAAMGNGGEIFIFDMGQSVKIVDLASKMIRLSGLEPGKDIEIIYTGLRPGEKLYEELLNKSENTLPTHHQQIMIAQVSEYSFNEVEIETNELISLFNQQDNNAIVSKLKTIIPEYKSNNSEFAKFDA